MVPLNSKRLNLSKWRSIAASFDLSTEAALAETRLIVEGKLTELGHDPFGIQVVLSDSDNDESVLYLVNKGGIIKRIDLADHVPCEDSRGPGATERSALRGMSELERLRQTANEHEIVIENLRGELQAATETIDELRIACANTERLANEVATLKTAVEAEKQKVKRFWRLRCKQMLREEDLLQVKDAEIARLREQLLLSVPTARSIDAASTPAANCTRNPTNVIDDIDTSILQTLPGRRGKAPPVESFTGEGSSVHWDDWLPTLERAATWNNWSEQEKLIQLAGHLRGRAQREWDIMAEGSKTSFSAAVKTLQARLDSGS